MVHLTPVALRQTPKSLTPSPEADAVVLAVLQRAQERLPDSDAPLADRLFALECAARGGRAVAPVVERYRDALREAEWWLDDEWELDVPHVTVLAQALSAIAALDQDRPARWPRLLTDSLDVLSQRQTKYGLGADAALIAVVLRGLDASGATPPHWVLDAALEALDNHPTPDATAELAEALARHRAGRQFLPQSIAAAFATNGDGASSAYARWWLAGRSAQIAEQLAGRLVDEARLQALSSATVPSGRPAAMMMEAAAHATGKLIIASTDSVSAARSRNDRRVLVSRAIYRGLFFAFALIVGLFSLHGLARALPSGAEHQHVARQCLAGVFIAGLGLCISGTGNAIAAGYGKKPPEWARYGEVIAIVLAGILGAVTT